MITRALVAGLGSIGQRHARNLRSILGNDLVLLALRSKRGGPVVINQRVAGVGDPEADCDGGIFTSLDEALGAEPDIVIERNAVVGVACQLRFHPALISLQAMLSNQVLGELIAVHAEQAEYLPPYHPYDDYRSSYAARADLVAVSCLLKFARSITCCGSLGCPQACLPSEDT